MPMDYQELQVNPIANMVHVCVCVENYPYNIGRHCFLWCDITYEQMQTSRDLRGASPEQSLDILSRPSALRNHRPREHQGCQAVQQRHP